MQRTPSTGGTPIDPSTADLDAAVGRLRDRAPAWCATDVTERLDLLRRLRADTWAAAPAWVADAAAARGASPDGALEGEEWGAGVTVTLRAVKGLETALADIVRTGAPQPPALEVGPSGQVVAKVFPTDWVDRLTLPGFTGEVRLRPEVTLQEARDRIGRIYRPGYVAEPAVAVVLGAGNVTSIPLLDTLYQLFTLDRVVVLKLSPVNGHLGPHLERAFAALIDAGYLEVVQGGADVAQHLVHHQGVDAVHLTGSAATHDAIVYGPGEAGAARRAADEPLVTKPMTSELGNVTPVIVVPGPWRPADLAYHGDNIASMVAHNAGFNCLSARVVVQHRSWARRQALLDAVRASLRSATPRAAYYPGARERWERFVGTYRSAERFGPDEPDQVPFTLIPEIDPDADDDLMFTTEPFCTVLGEVALDAPRSVPEFIDAAVGFCNERLAGTLTATIIVHPQSLRDPMIAGAVERAIDELAYGTVVVNHFPGIAFGLGATSWGAYPGSRRDDIGSGHGVVHDTYLLEDVQKSVVRGPFRTPNTPAWFHTNRRSLPLWRGVAEVTATGRRGPVPSLVWHSARG